jgi:Uma2 family endonuclease
MTLLKLPRSPVTLMQSVDDQKLVYSLTVKDYHRMIAEGLLPEGEPFELIEGQILRKERQGQGEDPMTVGHRHAVTVNALSLLNPKLSKLGCHIRIQQPITLPPYNEPEPDGAVVVGRNERYKDHHPTAKEVLCVIEVSEATLEHDRTNKQRVYAGSGIRQYLIINLVDRVIEVYTQPLAEAGRYGQTVTLSGRQQVTLSLGGKKGLVVPVKQLLV